MEEFRSSDPIKADLWHDVDWPDPDQCLAKNSTADLERFGRSNCQGHCMEPLAAL